MIINSFNTLLLTNLIINSNNWTLIWIFLELLTFTFSLTLIKSINNMIKFFTLQMFLSLNMILSLVIFNSFLLMKFPTSTILFLILTLKMNFYPINFWQISIQKSTSWTVFFNLNFIFKIPTIFLLKIHVTFFNLILLMLLVLMMLFNINNLKIFMYNLSINNMYWITFMTNMNLMTWTSIYTIYLTSNMMLISMFSFKKMVFINDISTINYKTKLQIMIMMMNLVSIPFLLMFNMKWIMIKLMTSSTIMIVYFIINLTNQMLYMKFIMQTLMIFQYNKKWLINKYFFSNNLILMMLFYLYLI